MRWSRTGEKRIGITLYEFGFLDDDINTPILVYTQVFDAEYDSNALYEGSGTVQFTAYLLNSPDPLDLDGGTAVGGGSGSFTFRRAGLQVQLVVPGPW